MMWNHYLSWASLYLMLVMPGVWCCSMLLHSLFCGPSALQVSCGQVWRKLLNGHLCGVLHCDVVLGKTTETLHVGDIFMWGSVHHWSQKRRTVLGLDLLGDISIDVLAMLRPLWWVCLGASLSSEHIKHNCSAVCSYYGFFVPLLIKWYRNWTFLTENCSFQ